jgi:non-ribosomal peptide synthetase component E (peptide arylation enzyme)
MEAARDAFDSRGYYKSGDLAKIDDRGFFSIVGRVKDMILRGGQNISPRRIEEMMEVHPKILEVAVAAMPDKRLGERACAFAVLKGGQTLSLAEVVSFLEEKKIVKWQYPERLEILDELPRSPGGKISKDKLTEFVANKMNQEIEGEAL